MWIFAPKFVNCERSKLNFESSRQFGFSNFWMKFVKTPQCAIGWGGFSFFAVWLDWKSLGVFLLKKFKVRIARNQKLNWSIHLKKYLSYSSQFFNTSKEKTEINDFLYTPLIVFSGDDFRFYVVRIGCIWGLNFAQ